MGAEDPNTWWILQSPKNIHLYRFELLILESKIKQISNTTKITILSRKNTRQLHSKVCYFFKYLQNNPLNQSKTDGKVAKSQKSHHKISNNCYYASTFLSTTIFKMNSLSQIKKKIKIFLKKSFVHVILLKKARGASAKALLLQVISDLLWTFRFLDFEPEISKISRFESNPAKEQGPWRVWYDLYQ